MPLVQAISDKNDFYLFLGSSYQAKNILKYLDQLMVKSAVLEDPYIDWDYMIDYQRFFCRSFAPTPKVTKRLHFFSKDVAPDRTGNPK